jgi:hypothetical protein
MNWAQVEPEQGQFNFVPLDKVATAWSAHGKRFTLIIRYVAESKQTTPESCDPAQQFLPEWEQVRIQTYCDTDHGLLVPNYFDPIFEADVKAFVGAIANHIAESPYRHNLLYVRAGVGIGGEGFPYFSTGDYQTEDVPNLQSFGYTPTVWAAWQKEMMKAYQQSFSYTTVIYPVNGQDTDPATGQPVEVENAQWAAAQGMGIGQQGLWPTAIYPFFQQLRAKYPHMYIQFQTVWSVGNTAGVLGDVRAAERNGAQFIEWYTSDIVNPANQPAFAEWQQYVNSTFGPL